MDWGDNQDAEKEFKNLVVTNKFSYPKPVKLLKNLFKSYGIDNITVLDFFAGFRVIIMITANSNDYDWISKHLLEKQNINLNYI